MKTRRFPNLARWLAGMYLVWSLFVYLGTLGGNGHEWWPLFLYFIIWPLSALYDFVSSACLDWFVPDPKSMPDWIFMLIDYVSGAFYIIVGTLWIWFLGKVISRVFTRLFPIKEDANAA
jgi:hypothetical protein